MYIHETTGWPNGRCDRGIIGALRIKVDCKKTYRQRHLVRCTTLAVFKCSGRWAKVALLQEFGSSRQTFDGEDAEFCILVADLSKCFVCQGIKPSLHFFHAFPL